MGNIRKKRVVMERLVPIKKCDRSFDLLFWKRVGVKGKFEAAWDMVRDLVNWNPKYAPKPRLRRSFAVLKQREG